MLAEYKYTLLRRMRGQIIGWGIGLALYGLMMAALFDSIIGIEGFEEMIASYPPELMVFFGDLMSITTPAGYLDIYYFSYMTMIIGIFAAGAGAGLLVSDEEDGVLDLILAHPIGRNALFWGRLLGFVTATTAILIIGWLSWLIPSGSNGMDLSWIEFLRPFLPLLVVLLLFGALALLFSMVLPSARMAGMLSGGLVVANFLVLGLANSNAQLEAVVKYTPLYYYQGGDAVFGLNWGWIAGLTLVSVILVLVAWWRFQQRDIRVGGEGGWQWPSVLGRLGRRAETADRAAA